MGSEGRANHPAFVLRAHEQTIAGHYSIATTALRLHLTAAEALSALCFVGLEVPSLELGKIIRVRTRQSSATAHMA